MPKPKSIIENHLPTLSKVLSTLRGGTRKEIEVVELSRSSSDTGRVTTGANENDWHE